MIGNIALYLALRLLALILPLLPLSVAYWIADVAGSCAYLAFPIPRRVILRNLSIVLDETASSQRVRRAARGAFQNDAKNWVDTLRIGRVRSREIERSVKIDEGGWERIVSAHAEGHGLILVTLHLGNYDLVGQLIALRGYQLTVPVERMRPPALYDFLTSERRSKGINAVPIEAAPRALIRALREGQMVAIAGDRAVVGRRAPVQFFGRTAFLPLGPVSLARRTGARVIVGCGVRCPSHRYRGLVSEPVAIQRTDNPELDDLENAQSLARVYEGFIREHPDQWLMFEDVWTERENAAATMKHAREAAV